MPSTGDPLQDLSTLRDSALAERAPVVVWMTDTANKCTCINQYWHESTEDIGVAYYNADASYAGYIGTCVDITEHKRQESAGQRVRQSLLLGQEAERKRLARELHHVNQKLMLTRLAPNDMQTLVPTKAEGLREHSGSPARQNE